MTTDCLESYQEHNRNGLQFCTEYANYIYIYIYIYTIYIAVKPLGKIHFTYKFEE